MDCGDSSHIRVTDEPWGEGGGHCLFKSLTHVACNLLAIDLIGRSNCLRWLATEVSTC